VVLGYFIGYFVVAYILLPLYYRLNLTSIYNYLQQRFGYTAYKTGALFFIISRVLGATARLYLVINVLQLFILNNMHVPFWLTAFVILLMILLYTFEGGVKTIVFTDTLQTTFMLAGLVVCMAYIMQSLNLSLPDAISALNAKGFTHIFNTDVKSGGFFAKQIIGGMFITIGMTGLDQEMMQKNISVKNLKDSQKNMITFSVVLVIVNLLFLTLGGLLYLFAEANHIAIKGDDLFPATALNYLPSIAAVIFIIGLISALFPSADGALTALTSTFCIDILGLKRNAALSEQQRKKTRLMVHFAFAAIFFLCVMVFKWVNNKSIIDVILKVAAYTYGPLLALFSFGIFTKRSLGEGAYILAVCIAAPVACYFLDRYSTEIFSGYKIDNELLLINGALTFLGLWMVSKQSEKKHPQRDRDHPNTL
jgi:Na+/proline symporter